MQYDKRSFWGSLTPVTTQLLIINVLMWLATIAFGRAGIVDLQRLLGLHFWKGSDFGVWQMFTYMFMHDTNGITHIFVNMFSLWMFGVTLERVLGSKRYLIYYIVCGLGAGIAQELMWHFTWQNILAGSVSTTAGFGSVKDIIEAINQGRADFTLDQFFNSMVTVGASGAVVGILLAFGMLFPNLPLYIIPIPFPIKAKWMVLGYGVLELFFGISGKMSGFAHFAHLGGMITGLLLILYWKYNGTLRRGNGYY